MLKGLNVFVISLLLMACGGSDKETGSDEHQVQLAEVKDFVLPDTEQVLMDVETHLTGLTLEQFYEQSFLYMSNRDDENAIAEGLTDQFDPETVSLADVSDERSQQDFAISNKILEMLNTYDPTALSEQARLSYDIYHRHLSNAKENSQYLHFSYPATYIFLGWPSHTESFFTQVFTIGSVKHAEIYLALLNQLQRRFTQVETLLETRRQAGIIEPQFTLGTSRDKVVSMGNTAASNTIYYQNFMAQISNLTDLDSQTRARLEAQLLATLNQKVLPAYQSLGQMLSQLYSQAPTTIGFGQFEGGEAYYQSRLRYFTSSDKTPEQIHQLGLEQLASIHAQMAELFTELGYPENESLAQSYNRVGQDAGIIKASNKKATYEQLIDDAYANLTHVFETFPEQTLVVVGGESGGYYIRGSDDGSRPGAFYANTTRDEAYTTMPTLAYHEGIPGHHLQLALASELDLPLFQRKINFTSFVEGWALYAERLAKDLGWYANDPYGDLGRLQFEAMRAARLVIDTGIHVMGWTASQADAFHLENVGYAGSIGRYSVWPGQATAYTTGMLNILTLRDYAKAELGDKYDIKEFHTAVIGNGSLPSSLLAQQVQLYIDRVKDQD